MSEIYSNAETDAVEFISNLSRKAESFGITDQASRPRVWVVQEVTLAAELWSAFAHPFEIIQSALKQLPMGEERLRLEGTERAWELVWHRNNFRLLDHNYGKNHVMNSVVNPMMGSGDSMTSSPHAMTPDYDKTYSPNRQIYAAGLSRRLYQLSEKEDISAVPEFRPSMRNNVPRAAPSFFLPDPETANVMYVASLDYNPKKSTQRPLLEPGFFFTTVDRLQEILLLSSDSDPGLKRRSEPVWLILAKASEKILSRSRHFESLSHLHSGSLPWLTAIWDKFAAHSLSPTGEALSEDSMVAFEFLYYLADALSAYRLFMTMRGGDFIVVFNGCNMPYAERARGKTGNRQEMVAVYGDTGTLQVIGPCYLHGIMKGEIFTDPNAAQFSHLKWIRYDGNTILLIYNNSCHSVPVQI
ncbi:heterokaryon incompatibility protein-domain-containing protein [Xylaria acuta]|nr:heterokaryon incompatibility protein-domain-containing protein [Xylaria acuta]